MRMTRPTLICTAIALLAWGSVIYIFVASFYYQYVNGYLFRWPPVPMTIGMVITLLVWIGTPILAFFGSLIVPFWLSAKGKHGSAEMTAVVLCVVGLPWAALQWIGLGAG